MECPYVVPTHVPTGRDRLSGLRIELIFGGARERDGLETGFWGGHGRDISVDRSAAHCVVGRGSPARHELVEGARHRLEVHSVDAQAYSRVVSYYHRITT